MCVQLYQHFGCDSMRVLNVGLVRTSQALVCAVPMIHIIMHLGYRPSTAHADESGKHVTPHVMQI